MICKKVLFFLKLICLNRVKWFQDLQILKIVFDINILFAHSGFNY